MSPPQVDALFGLAKRYGNTEEAHHGDCIGADAQFHYIFNFLVKVMHAHPCDIEKLRANCAADVIHEIKPPLERNRDIVRSIDILIAAPAQDNEIRRGSGTWATIRYARKAGLTIHQLKR